jgi:hypothetical protein
VSQPLSPKVSPKVPTLWRALIATCALCWVPLALAQNGEDFSAREQQLAEQRAKLTQERSALLSKYDAQERACWQRFAVNDCLRSVRRAKRADLQPMDEADWALAEQERALVQAQRRARLAEKNQTGGEASRP